MMPAPSIYPVTTSFARWMNSQLGAVEQSTFEAFVMIRGLSRLVFESEKGTRSKKAALRAIKQYNEDNGTSWSYKDVRDQCHACLWSDCGSWAVYTDRPDLLISTGHESIGEAIYGAPEEMAWAIMVIPADAHAIVFRSPLGDYRTYLDKFEQFCHGLAEGDVPALVLPAEVEHNLLEEIPTPFAPDLDYEEEVEEPEENTCLLI